jgi:hypothetical protein
VGASLSGGRAAQESARASPLLGITFERYSAECADRSPADAVLHRYLERVAGSARVLFEDALARVARSEGLALPANAGAAGPGR